MSSRPDEMRVWSRAALSDDSSSPPPPPHGCPTQDDVRGVMATLRAQLADLRAQLADLPQPPVPSPGPAPRPGPGSGPAPEPGPHPLPDRVLPAPGLLTRLGYLGVGMAACPESGALVISSTTDNRLHVHALPGSPLHARTAAGGEGGAGRAGAGGAAGMLFVRSIGGSGVLSFNFQDQSGMLAFVPSDAYVHAAAPPLLLVTDAGQDAVHFVDVVEGRHAGYLAAPGSIAGPRGVAASRSGDVAGVTAWKHRASGEHVVHLFTRRGATWVLSRVLGSGYGPEDGRLQCPHGVRISADGTSVVVADRFNNRVSQFKTADGVWERHVVVGAHSRRPNDVQQVAAGWLVANGGSNRVVLVPRDGVAVRPFLGEPGSSGEFDGPTALTVVPGLGLVVRECEGRRVQVFQAPPHP